MHVEAPGHAHKSSKGDHSYKLWNVRYGHAMYFSVRQASAYTSEDIHLVVVVSNRQNASAEVLEQVIAIVLGKGLSQLRLLFDAFGPLFVRFPLPSVGTLLEAHSPHCLQQIETCLKKRMK